MTLRSHAFKQDPRVIKARELLLEALKDHTKKLNTISPPQADKALTYKEVIDSYSSVRGTRLYYPFLGSGFGHGSLVELLDGSVKYDMITGIGVHFMGHCHPEITKAAFDAATSDTIMQGNLQQNIESYDLAQKLVTLSGLPHCFFTTSGAMANENALKVALQKNSPGSRVLAFDHCFAGRTLTFSQITDKPSFREGLPLNVSVDYIPFYDPENPEESTALAISTLKKHMERYPKSHAVMIFELIQGEAGFYVGSKPFFEALMKICKEHHIAVFCDEIQTFARTSKLFAFQHFSLEKYVDIVSIGKLCQICATLFTEEYKPKPSLLSQTFTGSTSSILAFQKLLEILEKGDLFGNQGRLIAIHERFVYHFKAIEKEHPGLISGPYGIGGMIAFTPYEGKQETSTRFVQALFEAGVIAFTAGTNPTRVRFLVPALVITDQEIEDVMKIVKATLLKEKPRV